MEQHREMENTRDVGEEEEQQEEEVVRGGCMCKTSQGAVSEQSAGGAVGGDGWAQALQGLIKLIKNNVFYQCDLY